MRALLTKKQNVLKNVNFSDKETKPAEKISHGTTSNPKLISTKPSTWTKLKNVHVYVKIYKKESSKP